MLLKVSGEAFAGDNGYGIDGEIVTQIAKEIVDVREAFNVDLAVVVGGGNIWRGMSGAGSGMVRGRRIQLYPPRPTVTLHRVAAGRLPLQEIAMNSVVYWALNRAKESSTWAGLALESATAELLRTSGVRFILHTVLRLEGVQYTFSRYI